MMQWWTGAMVVLLAAALGYYIRLIIGRYEVRSGEREVQHQLDDARREADRIRKDAVIQAKAEVIKAREEFENSIATKKQEAAAMEERLEQRELNLERKVSMLDKKNQLADQKLDELSKKETELATRLTEYDKLVAEERAKLQRIAGMTHDEARRAFMARVEDELKSETGMLIRRKQEEAKETAEKEARKIVALAVQRYAFGHFSDLMTSTVALPSDDMKGRIIGREGRNIRSIEAATGVDLLVDDTPEAVVISAFDPVRREIARQSLERLIMDGRIHPGRIEEVVAKVRDEMDDSIRAAGEEAVYAAGIQGVAPELVGHLGRLKFRTSYAQNVLMHSMEVAQLMGNMASEMELDAALAKRIGLFHDIGKALDSEVEGNHAVIGAEFLRRHGEAQIVLNAVAAHHLDVEPESEYAVLVAAADAISAARPGARSETSRVYVKRLEQLESISNSFEGVEKTFAIQAGREVRVIVHPDKIDDAGAMRLARDISKRIQDELQFPGQIKVVVIREKRCIEYAR